MSNKRIIINADDFGKSPQRNDAIIDAFKQGLISSAALIVTGRYLQDAVDKIKKNNIEWSRIHLHVNFSANLLHENSEDIPLTEGIRQDKFFSIDGKYKPFRSLPMNIMTVFKYRKCYDEIVAQYNKFREISEGEGDLSRIDFHLWYNLTWPVSISLRKFCKEYHIKGVRYLSLHQTLNHPRRKFYKFFVALSRTQDTKSITSCSFDYFYHKQDVCGRYDMIEIYCHPNYKENVLLDDTPSALQKSRERLPLKVNIERASQCGSYDVVSWHDICNF